jgi:2-polyprenyl-3-methyl-5-hydroxy-6-metoxy-1,4-benzoquinol methylase
MSASALPQLDSKANRHGGRVIDRLNGYDIIDCIVCGFCHADPLPPDEALHTQYSESYYRDEKPDYLAHAAEDAEWAALAHHDRLSVFERELEGQVPKPWRLLDIGCGPGFFLDTAAKAGWDVAGVEPSIQAADHARNLGLTIIEGVFSTQLAESLRPFHAVHMNHVLEHVADPATMLANATASLLPGGLICVNVPNDYNPLQLALRRADNYEPWWLAPPHHLNYFDFSTLEALLTRHGFRTVEVTTSFPMELFLLMGENYVGNETLGRACHDRRKRLDLTLERAGGGDTRRKFYGALARTGLGRDACIIARLV